MCAHSQLDADFAPRVEEVSEQLLLTDFADEAGLRDAIARTVRRHGIDAVSHCGHGGAGGRGGVAAGPVPEPPEVYERLQDCAGRAPAQAPRSAE